MNDIQITMTFSLKELMLLRYSMGIERATAEKQMATAPTPTPTDRLHYQNYIAECRRIETMLRDAQDAELKRLGKIK